MIETVMLAIMSAIIYAGSQYMKKHYNPEHPESFELTKFGATVVVGALIGALAGMSGVMPTELGIAEQLMFYSGTVAIVENILRTAYRYLVSGS